MKTRNVRPFHGALLPWFSLFSFAALCGDWPHWRGPDFDGVSREKGLVLSWGDAGPKVVWKARVGTGFSSFAAAEGRVFTMGNSNQTDVVSCLDSATGRCLWRHTYASDLGENLFEGGPTATPAVDGANVYTLSRWGDLFCLDAATGAVRWSNQVVALGDARVPGWGLSGSPLIYGDSIILNVGESGLALQKTDGALRWKSARRDPGYSTPMPWRNGDRTLILIGGSTAYRAVDPKTGSEAWQFRWLTSYGINASDPVASGDAVFISTGYGKGAALLKPGSGEPQVVWKSKVMRNQFNSSLLIDGFLYGVDGDVGQEPALKCVEFAGGTEKWSEPGVGSGALAAADGRLIVLTDKGELWIAPASPAGFKTGARAKVLSGKCWTTPVLSNGRLYCRNAEGDVVCLDLRPGTP